MRYKIDYREAGFLTDAETRADTSDEVFAASELLGRMYQTGLDPDVCRGVVRCLVTLGGDEATWAPAIDSDDDLIEALCDLEDTLDQRVSQCRHLLEKAAAAAAGQNANTPAAQHARQAVALINECIATLTTAKKHLSAVPSDLGERYEAVYDLCRQGRDMPYNGRWFTGDPGHGPTRPWKSDLGVT